MDEALKDLADKRKVVARDLNDLFDTLQIEVYKEQIKALQSELETVKAN